jgi:CRISPR-associated protein Cas1
MTTLYVVEQGTELGCCGERLEVRRDDAVLQSVPLVKVEDVLLLGNVQVTAAALNRLLDRGVEVTFLTLYGRYHGRLVGEVTAHVALRRAQYRQADDAQWALALAQTLVRGKVHNCRALLQRFARSRETVPPEVGKSIELLDWYRERVGRTTQLSSLLGVEGSATAAYFKGFRALLAEEWAFGGRKRRPPPDPVNVLLSLGYTLLTHKMLGAVQAVGFDPYQGFLHQLDYNRPSLALDLLEEFRPLLVDSLVLRVCSDGRVGLADFAPGESADRPVVLSDAGKRAFVTAFEERMRTLARHSLGAEGKPGRVTYLRCLELQSRMLARAVRGDGEYEPFLAR